MREKKRTYDMNWSH